MKISSLFVFSFVSIFSFSLVATPDSGTPRADVAPPVRREWVFSEADVTFDTRFDGSRLQDCAENGRGEFSVLVQPENTPINNSAWFAFRVSAKRPQTITVRLKIEGGTLRYTPKISVDGQAWAVLPDEAFRREANQHEGVMTLEVGPEPLWVAAQELVTTDRMESWCRTMERLPFVERQEFGRSRNGRTLQQLVISVDKPNFVVIVGRQHPPETTGSLALMHFVEKIAGNGELARVFRDSFTIVVLPLLNPDGVDRGHWRHNLGGVDLNRDWGTFAQPETTAARDQILALQKKGRIWLHLDFHSTKHDVFYTQPDDEPTSPAGFTKEWIDALQARFPNYKVNRSSTHAPTQSTSHNWAHRTLGIPGITYELGDETDRPLLQEIAAGAAEEMMKRLLELNKRNGR